MVDANEYHPLWRAISICVQRGPSGVALARLAYKCGVSAISTLCLVGYWCISMLWMAVMGCL